MKKKLLKKNQTSPNKTCKPGLNFQIRNLLNS